MFDNLYNSLDCRYEHNLSVQAEIETVSGKKILRKDGGYPFFLSHGKDPMTVLLKILGTELGISYYQIRDIALPKMTEESLITFSVSISSENLFLPEGYYLSETR